MAMQISTARYMLANRVTGLRPVQRRWARVLDVRFLASHEGPRDVYDKYKNKLETKAKAEGYTGLDQLREAYKSKISQQRQDASMPTPPPTPDNCASATPYSAPPAPQPRHESPKATRQITPNPSAEAKAGVKTLASFMDVEKTSALPCKEIEQLWRLRHANNPQSLCAAIPADVYRSIARIAKQHPQFILPLPREEHGAEIHFMQWTFPSPTTATVLFTHLAEFKLRGEFSQPHTTVTHHLDFADSKQVVLLQGSVLPGKGVSVDEGKWLLMCLQKFYNQSAQEGPRQRLLLQFSNGDAAFKVEELLEEAEKFP